MSDNFSVTADSRNEQLWNVALRQKTGCCLVAQVETNHLVDAVIDWIRHAVGRDLSVSCAPLLISRISISFCHLGYIAKS